MIKKTSGPESITLRPAGYRRGVRDISLIIIRIIIMTRIIIILYTDGSNARYRDARSAISAPIREAASTFFTLLRKLHARLDEIQLEF